MLHSEITNRIATYPTLHVLALNPHAAKRNLTYMRILEEELLCVKLSAQHKCIIINSLMQLSILIYSH